MKIRTRILSGFGLVCLLLLVSGGAGFLGVQLYDRAVTFITGPAWASADGSMNATIEVQNQLIATDAVVSNDDPQANLVKVTQAGEAASGEMDRLIETGLLDSKQVNVLNSAREELEDRLADLLAAWSSYHETRQSFDRHAVHFVELSEAVEVIGDGAVESIESNPDQPVTWTGGLSTLWTAADGGMESSIGFLTQLYHLNKMIGGAPIDQEAQEIEEALAFQSEAAQEMLKTGLFKGAVPTGHYKGKAYDAAYQEAFEEHARLIHLTVETYRAFRLANQQHRESAAALRSVLERLEAEGDQRIDTTAQSIVATRQTAMAIILIAIATGLITAVVAAWATVRSITRPINASLARLQTIADGDLTQRFDISRNDELGNLCAGMNRFVDKFHSLIREIVDTASYVRHGTGGIVDSNTTLSDAMRDQTMRINTVSAAVEEMSSSVIEVARQASDANVTASNSGQVAREGEAVVGRTITGMQLINTVVTNGANSVDELGQLSQQIGQVITVINGIADQTNLLALNAAIEAARAGEQGRGFAVVADEVRKLADRTTTATDEIAQSIQTIQDRTQLAVEQMRAGTQTVNEGVNAATEAGQRLREIVQGSTQVASLIERIAAAAEQQSTASTQIASDVEAIHSGIQHTTQTAMLTVNNAGELYQQAERLSELVGRFKV